MGKVHLYVFVIFLPFVLAKHGSPNHRIPHMCDALNESSEERCSPDTEDPLSSGMRASFPMRFFLYKTPADKNYFHELLLGNVPSVSNARPFPKPAMWKIIVHGFRSGGDTEFPQDVKNAYLDRLARNSSETVNVIVFDWSVGAEMSWKSIFSRKGMYQKAVENTKPAGEMLGDMITFLADNDFLDISNGVHIIGHSLGAHVAGQAARRVHSNTNGTQFVCRVSALDPAGPLFWKNNILGWFHDPYPRIHRNRVLFLDAYHTSKKYGSMDEIGDIDFFINGGETQPSCAAIFNYGTQQCSHSFSWKLFAKSINNDTMRACTGCYNYEDYHNQLCNCDDNPIVGEYAVRDTLGGYPLASGEAFYDIDKLN